MKQWMILMVVLATIGMTTSCNKSFKQCKVNESSFESFIAHFNDSTSFAYAEVGGRQVLLVSHETFGNNVNEDKEAIAASIFALDEAGKIVCLGSIRSQGTAYPVSMLDGKLMVAGHHFVYIYGIRGEFPDLYLDSYDESDTTHLMQMFDTFHQGTSIKFCKKLPQTTDSKMN